MDSSGRINELHSNVQYNDVDNSLDILSGTTLDVSNSMIRLSQSQKASIIESVGKDIDIGSYDLNVGNVLMKDLVSTNGDTGGGLTYVDSSGRVNGLEAKEQYNIHDDSIGTLQGTIWDVTRGMLRLSQSQKASIIESVDKDIDIGAHSLTLEKVVGTTIQLRGEMVFGGPVIYAIKVISPGAQIDPSKDEKCIFHISSSGSTLLNGNGQLAGHIIYITNTDGASIHTILLGSSTLTNINPGATAKFIFTGTHWSRLMDASSSGGSRRRLRRASFLETQLSDNANAGPRKLRRVLHLKSNKFTGKIDSSTNTVILNDEAGTTIQLPLATGSGRVIHFSIQQSLTPGSVYSISGHTENTSFRGILLMHSNGANSYKEILKAVNCNGYSIDLAYHGGGILGSVFEVVDVGDESWAVGGNLHNAGNVAYNPCNNSSYRMKSTRNEMYDR